MKYIISLLFVFLVGKGIIGQNIEKNESDFIIVVDENIAITSISSIKIRVDSLNSNEDVFLEYHPGSLSFKKNDYDRFIASGNSKTYMIITYREYVNEDQKMYNYEIEIKPEWLREEYCILRIYNLDKKKYKNKFISIENQLNYTYELDSPNYTFKRVRKK